MSRARELAKLGNINVLSADDISNEVGIATTVPRSTLDVRGEIKVGTAIKAGTAGVLTATSFDGGLSGNIVASACTFTTGNFTGNVTIGGTLTYEDVTNVDALGIITARAGVNVTGGQIQVGAAFSVGPAGVVTATSYYGDGSNLSNITSTTINNNADNRLITGSGTANTLNGESTLTYDGSTLALTGNETISSQLTVGSGITMGSAGVATFSGTADIHLKDNVRLNVGDGNDLAIYHQGTHSFIEDAGTGSLKIRGSVVELSDTGADQYLLATENGAVNIYYNGNKKWETTNSGTIVTGIATASGFRAADGVTNGVKIGDDEDLIIQHNGTNSFIDNNTGDLYIQTTGSGDDIFVEAADDFQVSVNSKTGILAIGDAEVQLYYNNAKKFETTNDGTVTTGISTVDGLVLGDNEYIKLGVGSTGDFLIYHDGSTNVINGYYHPIELRHQSEVHIKCVDDGAVELYHNNIKTFYTASDGIVVQGPDAGAAQIILASDENTNDTDKFKFQVDDGGPLYVRNKYSGSWETNIMCAGNGAVELYYDNVKTFYTNTNGAIVQAAQNGDANLFFYADEGDNNADKWLVQSESDGYFAIKNYASGSYEFSLKATGDAGVDLYYNNSKKFETTNDGVVVSGICTDSLGNVRSIPANNQTGSYTMVASDAGKVIYTNSGVTVPANVFKQGDAISIVNYSSSAITITQGSSLTLRTGSDTGNKDLDAYSMATIWFGAATLAFMSGSLS